MELGKLRLLCIDDGGSEIGTSAGNIPMLDAAFFSNIDAVLLDIAACQEKRIDSVGKGGPGPRPEVSTDPGDDSYTSGESSPGIPATATAETTRKIKAKIACSVPYDNSCRQAVIQSAVSFVRQKASLDASARRASDGSATNRPPNYAALTSGSVTLVDAAAARAGRGRGDINADMDAELAELQNLRDQRQWRHTLMARLERASRVTAAHTNLPPEAVDGAAQVPSVRELMGDLIIADDW